MRKTIVINAVGLTADLIGENTPRLTELARRGGTRSIAPVLPAVTCSVQASYLTGCWPAQHGIVGNGWYARDDCEIKFWKQASPLVHGERVWETARRVNSTFTCANICWWFAMYSSADFTVTPRPMYLSDGRKIPDCWTHPADLRPRLQAELGNFPLFKFWGPATSIDSTRWIAEAAIRVDQWHDPTLSLVYLPHLDYVLQRQGPTGAGVAGALRELDEVCASLIDHFEPRGTRVIVLSEYGISAVSAPVHLNRLLRENGLLCVREELGHELLDAGASAAFAVADHQIAHVYVNDPSRYEETRRLVQSCPGVAQVLGHDEKRSAHLDHPRSGELIALAEPDAWFTYYYWLEELRAPDFANIVDIHRKPGYDPAELFLDPKIILPRLRIAGMLAMRKFGFRPLLRVIPTDATLVKGSHGLAPAGPGQQSAIFLTSMPDLLNGTPNASIPPTAVKSLILRHLELN